MPTPSPGCHLVPRWRTMMLPASTFWPPDFFTPSRRPAESRPLRDEPPAFLCAIVCFLFFLRFGAGFLFALDAGFRAAGFVSFFAGFASALVLASGLTLASGFFSAFFGSGLAAALD